LKARSRQPSPFAFALILKFNEESRVGECCGVAQDAAFDDIAQQAAQRSAGEGEDLEFAELFAQVVVAESGMASAGQAHNALEHANSPFTHRESTLARCSSLAPNVYVSGLMG
jgi:hypothetical protein